MLDVPHGNGGDDSQPPSLPPSPGGVVSSAFSSKIPRGKMMYSLLIRVTTVAQKTVPMFGHFV